MKYFLILLLTFICGISHSQNLTFNTQSALDNYNSNTSVVNGNLIIHQSTASSDIINDITVLSNIDSVYGNVNIFGTNLPHLNSLSGLQYIGGNILILDNDLLTDVSGMTSLDYIGMDLSISSCDALPIIEGFDNLTFIGDAMLVSNNPMVTEISGFNSLIEVVNYLTIASNDLLDEINGFVNLVSAGSISFSSNEELSIVDGFDNVNHTGLSIIYNYTLDTIHGFENLTYIDGQLRLNSNAFTTYPLFNQLDTISGDLWLSFSNSITHLNDFSNLEYVGGDLIIHDNPNLTDCCGIQHLIHQPNALGGVTDIYNNPTECSSANDILSSENCPLPTITGLLYWDDNGNKIYDSGELLLDGSVWTIPEQQNIYSNNGQFELFLDSGQYILSYDTIPNWVLHTDSTEYHLSIQDSSVLGGYDFGFHPSDTFDMMAANIVPALAVCDQLVAFNFLWENTGTTFLDGTVTITLDSMIQGVDFGNSTPDVSIHPYQFQWNIQELPPFQGEQKTIYLQIPGITEDFGLGDSIMVSMDIQYGSESTITDSTTVDWVSPILCAYDPNDKLVSPDRIEAGNPLFPDEPITYTVRFQNTGNYFATDVIIRDTLSEYLDLTAFRLLGSSHPNSLSISFENEHIIEFSFIDIMLPDSTMDFEGSQGYVSFSIQPYPGTNPNTIIENTAHIYFDSNPAIVTNTPMLTYVESYELPTLFSQGCDSVLWNGEYLYEHSLELDSTGIYGGYWITPNLIEVYESQDTSILDTILIGEEYVLPDGQIVSMGGTYTSLFQTSEGCDSIITTILEVSTSTTTANTYSPALIYPNPTKNLFLIDTKSQGFVDEVVIYDALARVQYQNKVQGSLQINTENWSTGIYQIILLKDGIVLQHEHLIRY